MDKNNEDLTKVISITLRAAVVISMFFIVAGATLIMIKGGGDGHTLSEISSYNYTTKSITALIRTITGVNMSTQSPRAMK